MSWTYFVFRHNNDKTFLIWLNEEDHCRVISMQKDGNLKSVFERFGRGLTEVSNWFFVRVQWILTWVGEKVYTEKKIYKGEHRAQIVEHFEFGPKVY